jgi:hypothetical protein
VLNSLPGPLWICQLVPFRQLERQHNAQSEEGITHEDYQQSTPDGFQKTRQKRVFLFLSVRISDRVSLPTGRGRGQVETREDSALADKSPVPGTL